MKLLCQDWQKTPFSNNWPLNAHRSGVCICSVSHDTGNTYMSKVHLGEHTQHVLFCTCGGGETPSTRWWNKLLNNMTRDWEPLPAGCVLLIVLTEEKKANSAFFDCTPAWAKRWRSLTNSLMYMHFVMLLIILMGSFCCCNAVSANSQTPACATCIAQSI